MSDDDASEQRNVPWKSLALTLAGMLLGGAGASAPQMLGNSVPSPNHTVQVFTVDGEPTPIMELYVKRVVDEAVEDRVDIQSFRKMETKVDSTLKMVRKLCRSQLPNDPDCEDL